jgi:DNA-binding HxlR family transcriptional regulator
MENSADDTHLLVPHSAAACDAACPVQRTARVLDGKWTMLVLRDLLGGKKRYSELQRSLLGISPRLLAMRLRFLEAEGLLTRTLYPTVPPTTEYELTALGLSMRPLVTAMAEFGASLLERDARTAP